MIGTNRADPAQSTIDYKLNQLAIEYNLELIELMRLLEDWQNFIVKDLIPPFSGN